MLVRQLADRLRQSLWFVPGLGIALAAVAATLMLELSHALLDSQAQLPLIFGGGPEGARGMLQAIAGSVVTVAGVVFSITVVALQLTSTQFSPRVLRNFMRDRPTQYTLAVFMATIAYALLVLRTVRSADQDGNGVFVPGLAVSGALVLAFVSLVMLVYFIHHIGVRIQVTSIIESVANETMATSATVGRLADEFPAARRARDRTVDAPAGGRPVRARHSGYLQYLDLGELMHAARDHDLRLRVVVPPGGWVQSGAPLFEVQAPDGANDDQLADWLLGNVAVGPQRSMQQDIGFGVQQLVDIAVKALSPGINDPTTATQCIDRLVQVLADAGERPDPPHALVDEDGTARIQLAVPSFAALLRQAMEQVRHHGKGTPVVLRHLALSLAILKSALPAERRDAIAREAALLMTDAAALPAPERDEIEAILRPLSDSR